MVVIIIPFEVRLYWRFSQHLANCFLTWKRLWERINEGLFDCSNSCSNSFSNSQFYIENGKEKHDQVFLAMCCRIFLKHFLLFFWEFCETFHLASPSMTLTWRLKWGVSPALKKSHTSTVTAIYAGELARFKTDFEAIDKMGWCATDTQPGLANKKRFIAYNYCIRSQVHISVAEDLFYT